MLLRVVRDDDDGFWIQNLVEELIGGCDLLQRLLEGDVFEANRVGLVLKLRVVGDVDPRGSADEIQNVLHTGIGTEADDRQRRRGTEQRRAGPARFFAKALDGRLRARRFNAVANRLFQFDTLGSGQPVRGIQLERAFVLDERGIELIVVLEFVSAAQMFARSILCGALEGDLVFGLLGALLERLGVVSNG